MIYGVYLSASGVMANMYRQDVLANNLANVQTTGFMRDIADLTQRDPQIGSRPGAGQSGADQAGGAGGESSASLLSRLGGGVWAGTQRVSMEKGPIKGTGDPLDVALEGTNAFFMVSRTDPATGQDSTCLTRDGRFTVNSQGELMMESGQAKVLDGNRKPITVEPGTTVTLGPQGQVNQNGVTVARLGVASIADPSLLVKQGQGLMSYRGGDGGLTTLDNPSMQTESLEGSAVDPIHTMAELLDVTRNITMNSSAIRYQDLLMDRAVNTLGRVA